MQEEITSLQSQPALATKWTPGQQLTTVQTSVLHPLLATGKLWEIATGWLLSPTQPTYICRWAPTIRKVSAPDQPGQQHTDPAQPGGISRKGLVSHQEMRCLIRTSWPEARGSSYCATGPTNSSVLNQSKISSQGMLKLFLVFSSRTCWLPSNCSFYLRSQQKISCRMDLLDRVTPGASTTTALFSGM